LAGASDHREPRHLVDTIAADEITVLQVVPAMLDLLSQQPGLHLCTSLRQVFCGGEALGHDICARFLGQLDTELVNLYGPTETAVDASAMRCSTGGTGTVSIGRPIDNTRFYVLDDAMEPVPVGVLGELYIAGAGLARGYLGAPALTAASFVPDLHAPSPGSRRYRTGDLVRWRADGTIDFAGRLGDQLKLRGHRIEPGEIEAILRQHPSVQSAAVVARAGGPGGARLVAYVVGREATGAAAGEDELARHAREHLPGFMVPSRFVLLPSLPLTSSGKIDRARLPEPVWDRAIRPAGRRPGTQTEITLAALWGEVLPTGDVEADDSFFERGGHSLLAAQLVTRIARVFGVVLPVRSVFEAPTLSGLAERVDAALSRGEKRAAAPMRRAETADGAPLSSAQRRLWIVQQLETESVVYNEPVAAWLSGVGTLDTDALERALAALVERHEVLRTRFEVERGVLVQRVEEPSRFELVIEDLRGGGSNANPRAEAVRRATAAALVPFDLTRAPLLRAALLRSADDEHLLVLTAHHICADGWSVAVLTRELSALYRAFARGERSPLPVLPFRYADWARAEQELLADESIGRQIDYWRKTLAGLPGACGLPPDRPGRSGLSDRGGTVGFRLSPGLCEELAALGRRENATVFMVLLAGFEALIARASGATDIVVGTPIAHRPWEETYGLVGYFANTLVLRTDLDGDPTFAEIVRRTRRTALDAYAHQDVPFERLAEILPGRRTAAGDTLFQVAFVLEDTPPALELGAMDVRRLDIETGTSKFDLTLAFRPLDGGLAGRFEFRADLFERSTIERYAAALARLLEGAAAHPGERLSRLPLLGPADQQLLFHRHLRGDRVEQGEEPVAPLSSRFEAVARARPDAIAVVHGDEAVTYGELDRRAERLARRLRGEGVGPGALVGIAMDRSVDLIASILAVLRAGGAYVPLDPYYPIDHVRLMIESSRAGVVIVDAAGRQAVQGAPVRILEHPDRGGTAPPGLGTGGRPPLADDLAYVIYTSGSTGRPKGVAVSHRQVARLFTSTRDWFRFGEDDVWTWFHSYAFDFSVWEIWGALLHGGRLVIVPYDTSRDPEAFLGLLEEQRVTVLNQTPSAFRALSRSGSRVPRGLSLRTIIFGGEALDFASLAPWIERHGAGARLVNMYGITETTVHVTFHPVSAAEIAGRSPSLVGEPLPDMELHIVDGALCPVPIGIPGEICVGGAGLARGYLHAPGLTAERFVPHPRASGERLYRSGDLARRLGDGSVEYLGRADQQVKVRGFRIELGDIEAALLTHAAVKEARAIARVVDGQPDARLVAYAVPVDGVELSAAVGLRGYLAERLPVHMVPHAIVALEHVPLTATGKLDLAALPGPDDHRAEPDASFLPPRTPLEAALADVWATVLRVDRVGARDSFFALGGDSIRALEVRELASAQGFDVPLRLLLGEPSLERLAAAIESAAPERGGAAGAPRLPFALLDPADRARLPEDVVDAYPLTSLQQAMLYHAELGDQDSVYHDVHAFRVRLAVRPELLERAVADVVARHEALRTSFDLGGAHPVQRVHRHVPLPFAVTDLRSLDPAEAEAELDASFRTEIRTHFRIDQAPLLRVHLHLLAGDVVQLSLTNHHALLDGWSVAGLVSEVFRRTLAMREGRVLPPADPPRSRQVDLVTCEREAIASPAARAFFVDALRGASPSILSRPRARDGAGEAAERPHHTLPLTAELTNQLGRVARDLGMPLKSVLLAAHAVVMSLRTGSDDVVLGVVVNGRPDQAGSDALGMFLATLPVRLSLSGCTWQELARRAFEAERETMARRHYPLAEIQRAAAAGPLFDAIFNFVHFHVFEGVLAERSAELLGTRFFQRTSFALAATFSLDPPTGVLRLEIERDP
ncbi:MAG TPA: amino acid adenylation domain-containing protein, partial [Kofleriaceae bacterium]|nr:amino acid adenylation domain-containing protein [Kofleriaceae bacterium]